MSFSRRSVLAGGTAVAAGFASGARAEQGVLSDLVAGAEDFWLAVEAYTYAYALVTMEMTRRVITNVPKADGTRGPMGAVIRLREYPNASFRDVTAPNADTLYTTSFFDVGDEPCVLSLPDMADRYALFPMLDGWTTVFQVPGKRTTGTGAQTYLITGPGWSGTVPDGMTEYKSPTSIVWLLGRIYCTGTKEDYDAVHALQDEVKLRPLSAWGNDSWTLPEGKVDPSIDMKTAVRDQVNAMDSVAYFTMFCELLKRNPPYAADAEFVAKLAAIGIVPGQDFDASKFSPDFAAEVPKAAQARMLLHFKDGNEDIKNINGWKFTLKTGLYGTDYLQRAFIAAIGLGANRPQDAVYPTSSAPAGLLTRDYMGSEKYVMTFPKGQTPPVKGFWSLTMYDSQMFFVDNPLNRYSISARQELKANEDGSIDLLIQHESPGADKESNWLPAPADKFVLMLRLYWPDENNPSILDGSWVIPAVTKVG